MGRKWRVKLREEEGYYVLEELNRAGEVVLHTTYLGKLTKNSAEELEVELHRAYELGLQDAALGDG